MRLLVRTGSARREYEAAYAQRQQVLAKSRIPLCDRADALVGVARGLEGKELVFALKTLVAHAEECPVCRERNEYADRHGPPLPPLPGPGWRRAIDVANSLARLLHVPEGDAGKGRRDGLFLAVHTSVITAALVTLGIATAAMRGGLSVRPLGEALTAGLIAPFINLVNFFLAGWVFDATRRIQSRFLGYLIRGAVGAAVAFGAAAVLIWLVDKAARGPVLWLALLAFAGLGAIAGSAFWVIDRARGRLG